MLFRLAGPMKDKCFVLLSFFFFAPSSDFTANGLFVPRKQHPNLANGRSREVFLFFVFFLVVCLFFCEIWVTPRSPGGPRLGQALCSQNHVSTMYSGVCPLRTLLPAVASEHSLMVEGGS